MGDRQIYGADGDWNEHRATPSGPDAVQQYGDWLEELAEWDYWCTLTFRWDVSERTARRYIERWLEKVQPSLMWWGTERGRLGRVHIHGLISFGHYEYGPSAHQLWDSWPHGRSQFDQFDAGRGASHYVGKYVTKDAADYDVSVNRNSLFG